MALNPNDSAAFGMFKAVKDSASVFGPTNKAQGRYPGGDEGRKENEYTSKMSDEEIIDLILQWKQDFRKYYSEGIEDSQKKAFEYWLGKQTGQDITVRSSTSDPTPLVDNVIFTMAETMLPMVTRANPDPVVTSDPSDMGQTLSHAIGAALVYESDRQKLRRKLARGLRRWMWDRLGAFKVTWDTELEEIKTDVIPAKRFIFDRDGYIDEGGKYCGDYLGEKKKETASRLIEMFADGDTELKKRITDKVEGKLATKIEYIEWWYKARDVFYTLDEDTVLGKYKNPNWNYDIPEQEAQEAEVDEQGQEISPATEYKPGQKGINFLSEPSYPYLFLSVFSSGTHPYDETSLILQNTQLQDIVNRRLRQIDKNVENMNEGLVLSGKSFTADQAAGAANALRKGQAIIVPNGDVRAAATHLPAPALPQSIFENMEDMRSEIMNVGGTSGSTPQGLEDQKSVRGKIMIQQQDVSRFANITESLEQVADSIYNMWVQFMVVYYDNEHYVTAAGMQGGVEILEIKNTMFRFVQMLDITVKEGSLIPKDPLTQRNEAMDLWSANAIDPISFFKRLDEPDPVKSTESLVLWEMAKQGNMQAMQAYIPSLPIFGQALPQEQPGTGGPAVNPTPNPEPQPQPAPGSVPAVNAQESALLRQVPIQ